jgi:hypothetical protein
MSEGQMEDWQKRVIDEKRELDERLDRLHRALSSRTDIAPLQRDLMFRQASYMKAYSSTLRDRIEAFGGGANG